MTKSELALTKAKSRHREAAELRMSQNGNTAAYKNNVRRQQGETWFKREPTILYVFLLTLLFNI
jgi:hypothetical protein